MVKIGEFNTLPISRMVDFGAYLNAGEQEILIPGKWLPAGAEPGVELKVFVYTDSEDRLIATTMEPAATLGEFAGLRVKDVAPFGAFLDWGLEKDLLLPKAEQHRPVKTGEKVVVRISLDYKTNRLVGVSKLAAFLKPANEEKVEVGQEVDLLVSQVTPLGYQAVVDQQFSGMLYKNEVFQEIRVGDQLRGYIRKIREDGKLDLSLKAFGKQGMQSDRDKVLEKLQEEGGYLPLGDKSDAEEISQALNMSKKSYKRAIGILFRERKIQISDHEIRLSE